jgi:uncharacterized membrane protein
LQKIDLDFSFHKINSLVVFAFRICYNFPIKKAKENLIMDVSGTFLLLAGGLLIVIIAVIVAVVSSVVSAVAADQDEDED